MYQINWTDFAKDDFARILNFLRDNFSDDTALKFLEKTEKTVEQIEVFPQSFPIAPSNTRLRKAVISKNTSLFYKINSNDVDILYFWDNRMNDEF